MEEGGAPDAIRSSEAQAEWGGGGGGRDILQVGGPIGLRLPNDDWAEMTLAVIGRRRDG